MFGNARQTRSFCYVDDLIKGLVQSMASNRPERVNLSNPEEIAIGCLADEVIRLADSMLTIVRYQFSADDPVRRQPDISKAKEFLEWSPTVSLESGLKATISYFRDKLATPTIP